MAKAKRLSNAQVVRLLGIERVAKKVAKYMEQEWIPWPALQALRTKVNTPAGKKKPPAQK